jgi:ribosomal protein S18 acetylase RimI-like enzyme
VTVKKDNEAALAFYDSLGFELIDQSLLNPIFGTDSKNVAVLKYGLRDVEEISTISNG